MKPGSIATGSLVHSFLSAVDLAHSRKCQHNQICSLAQNSNSSLCLHSPSAALKGLMSIKCMSHLHTIVTDAKVMKESAQGEITEQSRGPILSCEGHSYEKDRKSLRRLECHSVHSPLCCQTVNEERCKGVRCTQQCAIWCLFCLLSLGKVVQMQPYGSEPDRAG